MLSDEEKAGRCALVVERVERLRQKRIEELRRTREARIGLIRVCAEKGIIEQASSQGEIDREDFELTTATPNSFPVNPGKFRTYAPEVDAFRNCLREDYGDEEDKVKEWERGNSIPPAYVA